MPEATWTLDLVRMPVRRQRWQWLPEQGTVAQANQPWTLEADEGELLSLRPAWAAETLSQKGGIPSLLSLHSSDQGLSFWDS